MKSPDSSEVTARARMGRRKNRKSHPPPGRISRYGAAARANRTRSAGLRGPDRDAHVVGPDQPALDGDDELEVVDAGGQVGLEDVAGPRHADPRVARGQGFDVALVVVLPNDPAVALLLQLVGRPLPVGRGRPLWLDA